METAATLRREQWSPARLFLAISAAWHISLGVIGLFIDRTFPLAPSQAAGGHSEHIFRIFETNGWHSLAALVLGVVSLYFALKPRRAREIALAIGVLHVGIFVALALWDPSTFLIASNTADQVVHSATAVSGLTAAVLTPRGADGAREVSSVSSA